jgi:hypothetical protein
MSKLIKKVLPPPVKEESIPETSPLPEDLSKEVKEDTDKLLDEIDAILDQDAVQQLKEQVKDDKSRVVTLADLMREGATVSNQAIGTWVTEDNKTCALSAAMLAARARGLA